MSHASEMQFQVGKNVKLSDVRVNIILNCKYIYERFSHASSSNFSCILLMMGKFDNCRESLGKPPDYSRLEDFSYRPDTK